MDYDLEVTRKYKCPKCSNRDFELGEFRAVGGFWSKIFNVQSKRFSTVTCSRCAYTEIYKRTSSRTGENILDILTN